MRRIVLLAALILLATPAIADAGAPGAWQRKALETAQRVWNPACGQLTLTFADPSTVDGDPAWAGWAYLRQCTIYEPEDREWLGYPEFCSNVLHEAGHAAGFEHREKGIMRPRAFILRGEASVQLSRKRVRHVVSWTGADPRCIRSMDRRYGSGTTR